MPHKWTMEMTYQGPEPKFDEIRVGLEKVFLTKARDEWFDLLAANDVPVGKVNSLDETFQDPQILHRKMVIELDHPKLGKVKQVGILPKLSDTPGQVRRFAPVHGEHTDEVLSSLGFNAEEIGKLRKEGTVG
jgi:formyl-CoA transferase